MTIIESGKDIYSFPDFFLNYYNSLYAGIPSKKVYVRLL